MRVKSKDCPGCGNHEVYDVTEEEYALYISGAHIQRAFPKLLPEERERFISGYCPTCWNVIMGGQDE